MASQLVYTSAAKLLDAGRSGFGTVARSKAISPLVVSALERVSQFANLRGTDRTRTIFVHRRITVANHRCHVLSRICDAGADYTGRTNHIAHHLVLTPEEAARAAAHGVTPADVLRQFAWLDRWDGAARFFAPEEEVAVEGFRPEGQAAARAAWTALTGQRAHARLLAWDGAPRTGVLLVPRTAEPLALLAEALHELGSQAWSRTFTTALESTDELSDLDWIVSSPEAFSEIQSRCGARVIFDLSQPATLPVPPEPVAPPPVPTPVAATAVPAAMSGRPPETAAMPHVQVVKLRTDTRPVSARPPVRAAPTVKQRATWIVAGSATVVLLAILGVATWKTLRPRPAAAPAEPPEVRLTDSQLDAVRMLRDAGVATEDAETVAEKSATAAREWATFVSRFLGEIKGKRTVSQSGWAPPPTAKEPDGVPAWLTALTTARNGLSEWSEGGTGDSELASRLAALSRIHGQLRSVAGDLGPDGLSVDSCDSFDRRLVEGELAKLAAPGAGRGDLSRAVAQLQAAIADGQFTESDFPARHKVLGDFAVKHLGLSAAETAKFTATGVVPKDLEKRLKRRADNPPAGSPGGSSQGSAAPDLSQVAPRSVIVVSRTQLQQGVLVDLLKQIMKARLAQGAERLTLAPLVIALTPRDAANETTELYLTDDKAAYCWTKIKADGAPRFYADGRVSLGKAAAGPLRLRYDRHEAVVVVNHRSDEWLRDDLRCELRPGGEQAVVAGELVEWLMAVDLRDAEGGPLEVHLLPENPELVVTSASAAEWRVARRPRLQQPAVVFSKAHADDVSRTLVAFKEIAGRSGSSRNAKQELEQDRQQALDKLEKSLCAALGGGLLSKDLGLPDGTAVPPGRLADVRRVMAEKYNLTGSAAPLPGREPAGDLRNLEAAVGDSRIDELLPKLGKKVAWSELAKDSASAGWIEEAIKAVLRDAKPPDRTTSLAEELRKVTHLTVRTRAGRALFKAARS
jgi:hypothetical protein